MTGQLDVGKRLAKARRLGDPDELADALARHADAQIKAGQFGAARAELDEAADIHRQRGRVYDQARTTHFAATLSRLAGDLPGARARASHALALVEPGSTVAVSALTELGEDAAAEGKLDEAADHFAAALSAAEAAGLTDEARAALARRRATVLVAARRYPEALEDLQRAHDLFEHHDPRSAVRVQVEEATAAQQSGDTATAERLSSAARADAERLGDHFALADLDLLASARAVERGELPAAIAAAYAARDHALRAVAPLLYVSAALAIARLSEASGDRLAAYDALATGWATLGDLLGHELARATFEPKLQEQRESWGDETFASVKTAYEGRRRPSARREQRSR
jgi:tetratricopeptide (TPR) repeat protein